MSNRLCKHTVDFKSVSHPVFRFVRVFDLNIQTFMQIATILVFPYDYP